MLRMEEIRPTDGLKLVEVKNEYSIRRLLRHLLAAARSRRGSEAALRYLPEGGKRKRKLGRAKEKQGFTRHLSKRGFLFSRNLYKAPRKGGAL